MDGKVAIITGASSGIGLAIAQKWVARGGRVALVARTASKLEAEARKLGEAAAAFPLDVLDFAALQDLPRPRGRKVRPPRRPREQRRSQSSRRDRQVRAEPARGHHHDQPHLPDRPHARGAAPSREGRLHHPARQHRGHGPGPRRGDVQRFQGRPSRVRARRRLRDANIAASTSGASAPAPSTRVFWAISSRCPTSSSRSR